MSEKTNRQSYVIDIETLKSCFTYVGINIDTEEIVTFVIHKERNELDLLMDHLELCRGHIGFNNIGFDYPVLHYLMLNYKKFRKMSAEEVISKIYQKAQDIIHLQNGENKYGHLVPEKRWIIPQLDLFKLWHYNNKARSTSLKALQIAMNYPNVMDMPIHHSSENITLEQIDEIIVYNKNDVLSTYEFYKKSIDKINLRKAIKKKYNMSCLNWNNGKIGEQLILKLYCEKTGEDIYEVRKKRTVRESINLNDCVPHNIAFKSKEFNKILDFYKTTTIVDTKGSVDLSVVYKGLKYVYGTGGIHAAISPGVYKSDDKYIIKSLDVASLYPSLAIVYRFPIEHLGDEFLDVYENDIVAVRLGEKAKGKDGDKVIIDGFKEAANIPYGKSNDADSFLYDPLYSMRTTISGQLAISMLCERLCDIPDSQMLMVNTDGCEIRIPREYEKMYNDICSQWEKEVKLVLEFVDYEKMWIADINNYGCITTKGKVKEKGRFEVDKVIGNEPAYHKDNSFKVVKIAIHEYFTKGTPVRDTIMNHRNIYDFCGRFKAVGSWWSEIRYIKDLQEVRQKLQKNNRYYISNDGCPYLKCHEDGREQFIEKGFKVTIFNEYIYRDIEDYNLNYSYYIRECEKMLNIVENKQLSIFDFI